MAKFQQSTPKPTVGSRVGSWLKAPAGGEAAKYGGLGGDYGEATALSVMLAVVLALLSWLYFKLTERWGTS